MKARLTLNVLTASLLLASCAQTQPRQDALTIQPFQEVQHSYDQAKAQYQLGRYYHGQLRYERAIAAYRRALQMDPGMVDALNAMGTAYAEKGDLARAREQFEAALKLRPRSVYTYNNLGFVNYLAGNYAAAVEAYKQALRLDGGHEKTRQNLVLAYQKMGSGERIARTEVPDTAVAPLSVAKKTRQNEPRGAWVRVSPSIYEMHSTVAPLVRGPSVQAAAPQQAATTSHEPAAMYRAAAEPPASADVAPGKMAPAAATAANPLRGVEVSNGNGVRGMAARVARYFSGKGIQQARLTNQRPFAEHSTRIEYRPGNASEAARINALLPMPVLQVASDSLRSDIRVRLVLGHDLGRDIAAWDKAHASDSVTAGLAGKGLPRL